MALKDILLASQGDSELLLLSVPLADVWSTMPYTISSLFMVVVQLPLFDPWQHLTNKTLYQHPQRLTRMCRLTSKDNASQIHYIYI